MYVKLKIPVLRYKLNAFLACIVKLYISNISLEVARSLLTAIDGV